jgi:hypothetical protein
MESPGVSIQRDAGTRDALVVALAERNALCFWYPDAIRNSDAKSHAQQYAVLNKDTEREPIEYQDVKRNALLHSEPNVQPQRHALYLPNGARSEYHTDADVVAYGKGHGHGYAHDERDASSHVACHAHSNGVSEPIVHTVAHTHGDGDGVAEPDVLAHTQPNCVTGSYAVSNTHGDGDVLAEPDVVAHTQ